MRRPALRRHLMSAIALWALLLGVAGPAQAINLVIATVNNQHMLDLQQFSQVFEQAHPGIHLRWVTLDEHSLRQQASIDIETQAEQFDVVTIGMYEVPIWARKGWLQALRPSAAYDEDDLLPNIRKGLSEAGRLYAAPLYGESSLLMYRKDLLRQAGLNMPATPTWDDISRLAARLDDPQRQIHGICLRGKPGWGENITLLATLANTLGGQWFDMQWEPQLDSPAWQAALQLYVDLLRRHGPPDAVTRGYNENLALFQAGRCALWVDASVGAAFVAAPGTHPWAHDVGLIQAPVGSTPRGNHWLWAWALAIPAGVAPERARAAQQFIEWATSRAYVELVAARRGWALVPTGNRLSTYQRPAFQTAAPWAIQELLAIRSADPTRATLPPSPYVGIQFASIPEFRAIGDEMGKQVAAALRGELSPAQALARSQFAARRQMGLADLPLPGGKARPRGAAPTR